MPVSELLERMSSEELTEWALELRQRQEEAKLQAQRERNAAARRKRR